MSTETARLLFRNSVYGKPVVHVTVGNVLRIFPMEGFDPTPGVPYPAQALAAYYGRPVKHELVSLTHLKGTLALTVKVETA